MVVEHMVEVRVTTNNDWNCTYKAEVALCVDGRVIANGTYGGEPEDNSRYRDYAWVEVALRALAEALGADFKLTEIEAELEAE